MEQEALVRNNIEDMMSLRDEGSPYAGTKRLKEPACMKVVHRAIKVEEGSGYFVAIAVSGDNGRVVWRDLDEVCVYKGVDPIHGKFQIYPSAVLFERKEVLALPSKSDVSTCIRIGQFCHLAWIPPRYWKRLTAPLQHVDGGPPADLNPRDHLAVYFEAADGTDENLAGWYEGVVMRILRGGFSIRWMEGVTRSAETLSLEARSEVKGADIDVVKRPSYLTVAQARLGMVIWAKI
jgi:hypothetical protein